MQDKPTLRLKSAPKRGRKHKPKAGGGRPSARLHSASQPSDNNDKRDRHQQKAGSDIRQKTPRPHKDRSHKAQSHKDGTAPKQKHAYTTAAEQDSRQIACHILHDIVDKAMQAETAERRQPGYHKLEPRDRGFVKLLVTTTLRRHGQLSAVLKDRLSDRTPPLVRRAIELGLCQYLFLDTKPHAAASTTVDLVKQMGFERQAGLTNAVLRDVIRTGQGILDITGLSDNLPQQWQQKWQNAYGRDSMQAMADMLGITPALDISTAQPAQMMAEKLGGVAIASHTVRCPFGGDIRTLPGYDEGEWWVQDAAAALPAQLFGDVSGLSIWDWCAAPGGKTAQLATMGAIVTSFDSDESRLKRLTENMSRLKLDGNVICEDVTSADTASRAAAHPPDGILLDAPCSATGTYRRRPDMLLRKAKLDLTSLAATQKQMLSAAIDIVKAGGVIIYSTCSLEPEEGEEVIADILNRYDGRVQLDRFQNLELGAFASSVTEQGWARILPQCITAPADDYPSGNDGFFIARLKVITS